MVGPARVIGPAAPDGGAGQGGVDPGAGPAGPASPTKRPLAAITFDGPLGRMTIEADEFSLCALRWTRDAAASAAAPDEPPAPLLIEAREQVLAYFDRRLRRFSLPLAPAGSRFQRAVWGFLNEIPFGFTLSYGELAALVGSVPRAVGRACGANPLPLIIPCHRIVAAGGLGGYSGAGGLDSKRLLLSLEGAEEGGRRLGLAPPLRRKRTVPASP